MSQLMAYMFAVLCLLTVYGVPIGFIYISWEELMVPSWFNVSSWFTSMVNNVSSWFISMVNTEAEKNVARFFFVLAICWTLISFCYEKDKDRK